VTAWRPFQPTQEGHETEEEPFAKKGELEMGRQDKTKAGQGAMMSGDLHQMRQHAHEMGIEGSSRMTEDQLRTAMKMVSKGSDPMMAKQEAKGGR
jgi:hypothetical protein